MKRNFVSGILLIVLIAFGAFRLSSQEAAPGGPDAAATDQQKLLTSCRRSRQQVVPFMWFPAK